MTSVLSPTPNTGTMRETEPETDRGGAVLSAPYSRQRGFDDGARRPLRVALLTNEIPPYRTPFYEELAATPGWDFSVFTCIEREAFRQWDVQKELPFPIRRSYSFGFARRSSYDAPYAYSDVREVHFPVGLFWDLWRFSPDLIISGELGARTLIAALYAQSHRRRLIVYSEGTVHTERNITPRQRWLRRLIRGATHAFLVNGRQGRQYLKSLNVSPQSIFEIGQALDIDSFAESRNADQRDAMRKKLGIEGLGYLFCGRMVPLKGLDQLLDAWEVFARQQGVRATLVMTGDGPERARLEKRIAESRLTNVHVLGFVPQEDYLAVFHAADVLVYPALMDCWALIVNEAMAMGLPVINSKYSGSTDLTVEGETGWIIDPFDRADMVRGLRCAWDARDELSDMKKNIRKMIETMHIPAVAERIRRAAECAMGSLSESDAPHNGHSAP